MLIEKPYILYPLKVPLTNQKLPSFYLCFIAVGSQILQAVSTDMDKHRLQEITEVEVAAEEEEPEGGELLEEQGIGLVTNYFPGAAHTKQIFQLYVFCRCKE